MDNLSEWGHGMIKEWHKTASALQVSDNGASDEKACAAEDLEHRAAVQNKIANICEGMCKEVGAYPKCSQCPDFVEPDSTPGVMTWPELLEHMDNLSDWGHGMLKGWRKTASALQKGVQSQQACAKEDLKNR